MDTGFPFVKCIFGRSLFFCAFFFVVIVSQAQPYVVENYHVQLDIDQNGVVFVNEKIDVDFNEKRRGIIRTIPLKYKNAGASSGRAIIMDDVNVKGDPFTVIDKGVWQSIRIGRPDVFLTGNKSYDISYSIIGAVEQFDGNAEFSWNIIGDEWDTKIKKSSATLNLPFPIQDAKEDVLFFINRKPISGDFIELSEDGRQLRIQYEKRLRGNDGMTLSIRFKNHRFPSQKIPAAVLSDAYYVPKLVLDVGVTATGEIMVQELRSMVFLEDLQFIQRRIPIMSSKSDRFDKVYAEVDRVSAAVNEKNTNIQGYRHENVYALSQYVNGKKGKRQAVNLKYNSYGNVAVNNGVGSMVLSIFGDQKKALVDSVLIRIQSPYQVSDFPEIDGYNLAEVAGDKTAALYVRSDAIISALDISIPLKGVDENSLYYPPQSRFANRRITHVDFDIDCASGYCDVIERVDIESKVLSDEPDFTMMSYFLPDFPLHLSTSNFLRRVSHYQIDKEREERLDDNTFEFRYRVKNLFHKDDLILPFYQLNEMEGASIDARVRFKGEEVSNSSFTIDDEQYAILHRNNYTLKVSAKEIIQSSHSIGNRLAALFRDNLPFWISMVFAGFLFYFWNRYGRDQKYDGSTQSSPPEYLTPAEAGYLWDGKLHGRDLISLIYHWAARGLLRVEEIDGKKKKDYYIHKLAELPADALDYEKTIFAGLLDGKSRVKISSLRESFYTTMKKANKELKATFEKRHLYEPNTRGIGVLFVVLGFLVFAAGLVLLGLRAGVGDYSWSLPVIIAGMAMLIFGYYLPKKTALGSDYFIALQRFEKFMEEAPPEELAKLYENDSAYFQNTLAFAIVLGKAKEWARRFAPIMTKPPSYYQSSTSDSFSSIMFTDHVLSSMHTMEKDFYSLPAPDPSSGSGSYSGSRGSSFGGGSFGGGFGGGGGSSW